MLVRKLNLTPGDIEVVGISSNGFAVSIVRVERADTWLFSRVVRSHQAQLPEVAASSLTRQMMTAGR